MQGPFVILDKLVDQLLHLQMPDGKILYTKNVTTRYNTDRH